LLKSSQKHLNSLRKDMDELLPGHGRPIGTVRVDVQHIEQLRLEAVCWEGTDYKFKVTIDEPPSRGGDAAGPAPLSYFVLGAATCLMTQYVKIIILNGLKLDSISMRARGHFDRQIEGAFTDIVYDVRLTGSEDSDRIRALAKDAEEHCFATNTLKRAIRLVTNVEYNGQRLVSLTASPP
jgi:uncharacterized OsmC-like protein